MKTKLTEFTNSEWETLRWIISLPESEINWWVICLSGFERSATTEKKFKTLADKITSKMLATLRFDFSGLGLSDGDFRFTTIEKQGQDLLSAIENLEKEIWNSKINIVAHSLGACVLASQIEKIKDKIGKIILISPALNQKELLRYRFTSGQMKKINPILEINWQNYQTYLNEWEFLKDCEKTGKMSKANYINSPYFLINKDIDFSSNFKDFNSQILHIHGNKDIAVPFESLSIDFINKIIVENWDHDMERPDQFDKWINEAVEFLVKNN
ncbi:MAG: hypothetical protein ACD_49C00060G0019 [uncultured bacterium (gcode 4)]|uniref:Serine aminopeptidase S33 domain-containing protein n=1 Tax=uncultured bacterium (gcode 4) TaxID=1234023 RepID=K2AWN6_9BACT|nr:MAG: hypothetical protein ACD_49C00060G0019 [uncultured bacterium (gcode 4)]